MDPGRRIETALEVAVSSAEAPGAPPLCAPLELDDFVAFVNGLGPQEVKRMTKNDLAFEKQLVKKKP